MSMLCAPTVSAVAGCPSSGGDISSDDAPAASSDPDIPRLTLSKHDMNMVEVIDAEDSAVNFSIDTLDTSYRIAEDDCDRSSDSGNEQDDEDTAEEDNNATDKAEDFDDNDDDDDDDPVIQPTRAQNDVEASFIQCTKPPCSKTQLVSCLSSRSTSPGPISPLLSDDEWPSISCSSSFSSRRSSSAESSNPRVRFKRGCVITQVNLTWAATSYDRAPIDVGESLDMKRCQSIEDAIDVPAVETDEAVDDQIMEALRGRQLHPSSAESADEEEHEFTPTGTQETMIAPPSPPLPSSSSTAAHANYAYSTTFGDMFGVEGVDYSSLPSLSPDESSTGSGSESEDCHWSSSATSRSATSTSSGYSRTLSHHPSSLFSAATAESSLGLAAIELSKQSRREEEEAEQAEEHIARGRLQNISCPGTPFSDRPGLHRAGSGHEISPPPVEEQPARKAARYGMCAMGKFSSDEVFDACDALGGF